LGEAGKKKITEKAGEDIVKVSVDTVRTVGYEPTGGKK